MLARALCVPCSSSSAAPGAPGSRRLASCLGALGLVWVRPQVLHSAAKGININPVIWNMYFEELLPAIADPGDDFN